MVKVRDIYDVIQKLAPFETQWSMDNCGLLLGDEDCEVSGCILSLDVTNDAIKTAVEENAQLIVTHHPIIFNPIKTLLSDTVAYKAARAGLSVISAHTNLDIAENGVNVNLAKALELNEVTDFLNKDNIGLKGKLPYKMTVREFAQYAKEKLNAQGVRFCCENNILETVSVVSGSCGDYLKEAKEQTDAMLVGEAKLNQFIDAHNAGFPIVAAGHHDTEKVVLEPLAYELKKAFPNVDFKVLRQSVTFCL